MACCLSGLQSCIVVEVLSKVLTFAMLVVIVVEPSDKY
jgi:hypothetical protein